MNYPYRISVNSPIGNILVQGSKSHIQYLKFESVSSSVPSDTNPLPDWSIACRQQLAEYFSAVESFEFDLPIDPQGSEFQRRVWQALRDVKHGALASYQQIAIAIGNEKSVRAVATANARNPIWLVIPCHRIIGSDKALRGYAGGIERKAILLQLEHHQLSTDICGSALSAEINEKTKVLS